MISGIIKCIVINQSLKYFASFYLTNVKLHSIPDSYLSQKFKYLYPAYIILGI